jgi:hypothetical protein
MLASLRRHEESPCLVTSTGRKDDKAVPAGKMKDCVPKVGGLYALDYE